MNTLLQAYHDFFLEHNQKSYNNILNHYPNALSQSQTQKDINQFLFTHAPNYSLVEFIPHMYNNYEQKEIKKILQDIFKTEHNNNTNRVILSNVATIKYGILYSFHKIKQDINHSNEALELTILEIPTKQLSSNVVNYVEYLFNQYTEEQQKDYLTKIIDKHPSFKVAEQNFQIWIFDQVNKHFPEIAEDFINKLSKKFTWEKNNTNNTSDEFYTESPSYIMLHISKNTLLKTISNQIEYNKPVNINFNKGSTSSANSMERLAAIFNASKEFKQSTKCNFITTIGQGGKTTVITFIFQAPQESKHLISDIFQDVCRNGMHTIHANKLTEIISMHTDKHFINKGLSNFEKLPIIKKKSKL